MSFQDGQNFSRATTPGRSLVENLKPISRKLDNKDMHPKNDLTKHFKDFMSSNSTNLKRVRSFSQPKETGESRIKFSSNIKDINSTCEKYDGPLYRNKTQTKNDNFSEVKANFNLNESVTRDRNNNSTNNEGSREKIIYKKSKTSPLFSSVHSNCKFESTTYSKSDEKKAYFIDSKFSSSIENCMTHDITRKNQSRSTSRFSRESWHRIHNKFTHNKLMYPVQRETFL